MRLWYRDELVPLLRDVGFATVDVLRSTDANTFFYVATRRGENAVEP